LQPARHNRARLALKLAVARRLEPDPACLRQGIDDVQEAARLGPVSADLCYDAARLCALATRSGNDLAALAIRYASQAAELGMPVAQLRNDYLLRGVLTGAVQLKSSGRRPSPAQLVVDPIEDDVR